MADRKIQGFKKFSDMKNVKDEEMEEVQPGVQPDTDSTRPMNPNLPLTGTKTPRMQSRKGVLPKLKGSEDQNFEMDKPIEKVMDEREGGEKTDEQVQFYGRVAKFPKKTKASKALNFLENVKISKNSIWYLLIEKQENELQMVKYNNRQGFDLNKFVLELKGFYIKKWAKSDPKLAKLVESIEVKGAEEFSAIRNIPNIEVEPGKKLVTKITEDLIKLLSK
jgi:hypothetical protein